MAVGSIGWDQLTAGLTFNKRWGLFGFGCARYPPRDNTEIIH